MQRKILALGAFTLLLVGCQSIEAIETTTHTRIPDSEFIPVIVVQASVSPQEPRRAAQSIVVVSKPTYAKVTTIAEGRAAAKAFAQTKVSSAQYPCLLTLWDHESHWNYRDLNTSSGAYGIPQALPGSKMASAGSDWKTNPLTQVKWGLGYINGRYGSSCQAWAFWQLHRWY